MMPRRVDLPQPDGPITETISPARRCRPISSSTVKLAIGMALHFDDHIHAKRSASRSHCRPMQVSRAGRQGQGRAGVASPRGNAQQVPGCRRAPHGSDETAEFPVLYRRPTARRPSRLLWQRGGADAPYRRPGAGGLRRRPLPCRLADLHAQPCQSHDRADAVAPWRAPQRHPAVAPRHQFRRASARGRLSHRPRRQVASPEHDRQSAGLAARSGRAARPRGAGR